MTQWIDACETTDIDEEDLIAWEHNGHSYAIYNTKKGFFASDVMCTHEEESLEQGLGLVNLILVQHPDFPLANRVLVHPVFDILAV